MASTPDRTAVKKVIQELVIALRTNLVADPLTATKPFRRVDEGPPTPSQLPRPFLSVWLTKSEPTALTEGDKILRVTAKLKLVTDVLDDDPHDTILDKIGAVDDYFDSLITGATGVTDGADGFEDRTWTFDYPAGSTGGRMAAAECELTFIVKVERGFNRVPQA